MAEFVGDASLLTGSVQGADRDWLDARLDCSDVTRRFRHYDPENLEVGSNVAVALRPEHLAFVEPSAAIAAGTLLRTIFLGDSSRHEVRLESATLCRFERTAMSQR